MTVRKNGFILYQNYFNQLALLSMEERGILITAIFEYTRDGRITLEIPPMVAMAFSIIKDTLDRDMNAYVEQCRQNSENGKKGGRPKKQPFFAETERFSEKAKKADNDKENENEKGNDNDNDMEKEKERNAGARIDPSDASPSFETGLTNGSAAEESVPLVDRVPQDGPVPFPAPRLSKEDEAFLREKGIPEAYVTERRDRAVKYARSRGRSLSELLLDWWQTDRTRLPWKQCSATVAKPSGVVLPSSSFDTDDFFQAALNHSFREMGLDELVQKGQRI